LRLSFSQEKDMKKLKVGMIGGGGESFFGKVHARAVCLDTTREVTAGALRSDPEKCLEAAEQWGIRGYKTWNVMLDAWKKKELELDYITIVTPNHLHFRPAMACLEAGMPVVCEKPVTLSVDEAVQLKDLADRNQVPFVLAHTYTGHPMMMMAREMIRAGDIGRIRKIESWYTQGWLAGPVEAGGQKQALWRTDPARSGMSNCGGDIGTHAFVAATWVSGLKVKRVQARLNSFVQGRALDDDFNVFAEMDNGAMAVITATQIAVGYRNDNGFRIFGDKGSVEWRQESAEHLVVRRGEHDETYWLGSNFSFFPENIRSYLRLPAGHHEDFLEALANLHCTMERLIRRRRGEQSPEPYAHPGVQEGVDGMKFIAAAVASSMNKGTWTTV
jgi:predicted dehydrogenase